MPTRSRGRAMAEVEVDLDTFEVRVRSLDGADVASDQPGDVRPEGGTRHWLGVSEDVVEGCTSSTG